MIVGVVNAGSATVKGALAEVQSGSVRVLWRATLSRNASRDPGVLFTRLFDQMVAEQPVLHALSHRVVHGGQRFTRPVLIDPAVEQTLEGLSPLAPLHNPVALEGIRLARQRFSELSMVAVFDTAFHAQRAPESLRYPLPWTLADEVGLFRYGFHGIAHASLMTSLAQEQGIAAREVNAVTLQLGAGCSACAISRGRSIETTMGFSPLGGLPMATRSGDLDPAIVLELLRQGRTVTEVEDLLTRRSGLLGMAGSGDMRDVLAAEDRGDEHARVALALFVRRIVATVGAYFTLLDGHGGLVFGGGIGTHADDIRHRIAEGLKSWNVALDPERNSGGRRGRISMDGSRAVYVFDTDEEVLIAQGATRALHSRSGEEGGT